MNAAISRRDFLTALGATAALGAVGHARADPIHAPLDEQNAPPTDKTVIGIYPSWSRYERNYMPGRVPLDQVTHLQYAFLSVEEDGSVAFADGYADRRNLAAFRDRKRDHPNTKMILSIGGFFASEYYSNAAQNSTRRARFARTAIEIMREYDFDGLDLDWRYPGGGNPNAFTREGDVDRFMLLLQEVRRQLDAAGSEDGTTYELSISASIDPEFTEGLDVAGFADAIDRVNVMAFDYTGPWEERTGFNAPLYNPFPDSPDNAYYVANAMSAWREQPIDPSKLNLAFASYGRGFTGVGPENRGFDQPFDGTPPGTVPSEESGTYDYWDIEYNVNADNDYEYHWHDDAAAPFLYSESDGVFVTYDNMRSVSEKAQFVADEEFGGMTMWDFHGDKRRALLYAVNTVLAE
ncbi:glycoside hydrolase family 18 protein [Haloarcula marina]|uniref:glycoside hydrolase family 18 protein n=1 Tax=Haloarcula marina TaxID=2961574 RepID=UPI0020B7C650|nr:glycoside hydrolase family 18 protein [Halomicroarcula marina]